MSFRRASGTSHEAEDLFPPELIQEFVDDQGQAVYDESRRRPDGLFHYDLNSASKELLGGHLEAALTPTHLDQWLELLQLIRKGLGPGEPEVAEPSPAEPEAELTNGVVLVVSDQIGVSRYQKNGAISYARRATDPAGHIAPCVHGR